MQWVQLASEEQVFLLDVPALCARHAEALPGTLGKLLAAPHVLKVGFGLRGDVKELRAAHPALADCAAAVSPVLELRDSWERARAAGRGRPAKPHPTPSQPLALTPTFPLTLTDTLSTDPDRHSGRWPSL